MKSFIISLGIEAGKILLQSSRKLLHTKGDHNELVSVADKASNDYIISAILKKYPSHSILSEETPKGHNKSYKDHVWIIDPVDGTHNYMFGLPFYSVTIAHAHEGVLTHGVVYDPERGKMYYAEKDKGAWCGEKRLRVRSSRSLKGELVAASLPSRKRDFEAIIKYVRPIQHNGARFRAFNSAALSIAYVASGALSLFYEIGLEPWDIAAGTLLVQEAGGVVRSFDKELNIFRPSSYIAGNKVVVDEFVQKILQNN